MKRPLAISVGDPAGVGPIVSVTAAAKVLGDDRAILFGDGERLKQLADAHQVTVRVADSCDALSLKPGDIGVVHTSTWSDVAATTHRPTAEGGMAQKLALDAALRAVQSDRCRALVTGPVSKQAISAAGARFTGHTEYLAESAGLASDEVTMMFLGPRLRVSLVTTHWPVRQVADEIQPRRVIRAIDHLCHALLRWTERRPIRVLVCGLNPHAGEGGLLGDEERLHVTPAIDEVRGRFAESEVHIEGPAPAEAVFRFAAAQEVDGVVAMYHDQATIASKLLDWGEAVNVTWGLPFVRTSVDHGVAYDAAQRGVVEDSGMRAAIIAATRLSPDPE